MTVGRDIAALTSAFAVGIITAGFIPCFGTALISTSLITTALLALSFHIYSHKEKQDILPHALPLFLLTGMICCISDTCRDFGTAATVPGFASVLCENFKSMIENTGFENPETIALIKALLTGDRSSLSEAMTSTFRMSGASHILALSGLHLGIIYGFISKVLSLLGRNAVFLKIRGGIIISICGIYTLATGAGESIVRAFLFIMLNEVAKVSGRSNDIRQILPAAMLIQLSADPSSIRSVSFQLSYSAMAGIAYILPFFKNIWPKEDAQGKSGIIKRIWDSASVSIACQISTFPFAWIYFRSFPVNFLISNLLGIPLSCIAIPAAALTVILSHVGICPEILISFTEALFSALTVSLEIISGF